MRLVLFSKSGSCSLFLSVLKYNCGRTVHAKGRLDSMSHMFNLCVYTQSEGASPAFSLSVLL